MYRGELDSQVYRSPDSVATTTPIPGHSSSDTHLETKSQLEAYIASVGIPAYVSSLDKEGLDKSYLAWEEVRRGRAAELVGKVFGADGKPLPYTGFEGYFVGLNPQEIVGMEVRLGEHIRSSIHRYPRTDTTSDINESELKAALRGEKMSIRHVAKIMQFYDCLFKDTLARAKANTSSEKYEHFQAGTYQRLESGQTITQTVTINTSVTIGTAEETEAYQALAQIGVFGHPNLREMNEEECEETNVEINKLAELAFPLPSDLFDNDNPLSR